MFWRKVSSPDTILQRPALDPSSPTLADSLTAAYSLPPVGQTPQPGMKTRNLGHGENTGASKSGIKRSSLTQQESYSESHVSVSTNVATTAKSPPRSVTVFSLPQQKPPPRPLHHTPSHSSPVIRQRESSTTIHCPTPVSRTTSLRTTPSQNSHPNAHEIQFSINRANSQSTPPSLQRNTSKRTNGHLPESSSSSLNRDVLAHSRYTSAPSLPPRSRKSSVYESTHQFRNRQREYVYRVKPSRSETPPLPRNRRSRSLASSSSSDSSLDSASDSSHARRLSVSTSSSALSTSEDSDASAVGTKVQNLALKYYKIHGTASSSTSARKSKAAVGGLENLGNTCYMNAVLQPLASTTSLVEFFSSGKYLKEINTTNRLGTKGALVQEFAKLIDQIRRSSKAWSPNVFHKLFTNYKPDFSEEGEQQDAQEFLGYLLDGLHEDLNLVHPVETEVSKLSKSKAKTREKEVDAANEKLPKVIFADNEWETYRSRFDSFLIDTFQGQFLSVLRCMTCEKTSSTCNAFQTISVSIPTNKRSEDSTVDLIDCLKLMLRPETLTRENRWNCPRCKKSRDSTKTLSLARLPPRLIIHIKRFSTVRRSSFKVSTPVEFPLRLDLRPFMDGGIPEYNDILNHPHEEEMEYRLYAVTNHYGDPKGLESGHYTSMTREGNQWYEIDDDAVEEISTTAVKEASKTAYILWYELPDP